jgi:hypothetical protein
LKTLQKVTIAIALVALFTSFQSAIDVTQILSKPETRKKIMNTIANDTTMSKEMMEGCKSDTSMMSLMNKTMMEDHQQKEMMKNKMEEKNMMKGMDNQMIKKDNRSTLR